MTPDSPVVEPLTPSGPALITSEAAPVPAPFAVTKIIAGVGAIQGLTIAVNLIRSKTIAVMLGPVGVGIVSIIDQIITTVVLISSFSLPIAGMKFLSRAAADPQTLSRMFHAFVKSILLLSFAGAAVVMAIAMVRPSLLGADLAPYRNYLLIGLLVIPTMPVMGYLSNALAAMGRFKVSAVVALIGDAMGALAAYLGILLAGIVGLYEGRLLVGVIMIVGVLWYMRRSMGIVAPADGTGVWKQIAGDPEVRRFCGAMYLTAFTGPTSYLIARVALLKHAGMVEVGLFQSVFAIGTAVNLVLGQAGNLYLLPAVNQNIPKADKQAKALEFQRSLCLLIVVAATPLVLFPREVLYLLYSRSFTVAAAYLFPFVLSECALVLTNALGSLLIGYDDIKVYTGTAIFSQICLAAAAWAWARNYGLWGITAAFLICRGVLLAFTIAALARRHALRMPATTGVFLGYTVLLLAGLGLVFSHSGPLTWQSALMRCMAYAAALAVTSLFLNREERASIARIIGAH